LERLSALPVGRRICPEHLHPERRSYTVELSVTDAAGNLANEQLGTVASLNAPANTSAPSILAPETVQVGSGVTAQPGESTAPAEAGTIGYAYQWERCDSHGEESGVCADCS
jgi:hypothetical protein